VIAVPTTSGTGSEATHFAVIYVAGAKHSVARASLRPAAVVLDLRLHMAMPATLAAVAGLDALTQAIESLWAVGATQESTTLARQAAALITPALVESVRARTPAARRSMMQGSHLSGRAINISKTTAAHALSYAITKRFGVAHGHAVALLLGPTCAHAAGTTDNDSTAPNAGGLVRARVAEAARLLGSQPDTAPNAMRDLLRALGLASTLGEAGVPRAAIPTLAAQVNAERLSNHPRRLTGKDLEELLDQAW
jgi:alcohol dehydrogenase class IV